MTDRYVVYERAGGEVSKQLWAGRTAGIPGPIINLGGVHDDMSRCGTIPVPPGTKVAVIAWDGDDQ